MKAIFQVLMMLIVPLLATLPVVSQQVWSSVSLNRNSAYLGQPVEVEIVVYTSTWFTRGIDPGNIQVEGAFTVFFRPVSQSIKVDGKTYAGVRLIYQVFPYSNQDIVFPSLKLTVESPPEGQYKGVQQVLSTEEQFIDVKSIPPDIESGQWLVTTRLSVKDQWSQGSREIKVGDVLSRTIDRTANGTVSELIPPIEWDSVPGVSLYPTRSQVQSHKTKTSIYATRTETMRYLFTKEGKVTIPAKTLYWFHPFQEKLYKRTLQEIEFNVLPNPNLGMLASLTDSLDATLPKEIEGEQTDTSEEHRILGMSPMQFAALTVLSVFLLWILLGWLKQLIRKVRQKKAQYRQSEPYYFKKFLTSIGSKKSAKIWNALYLWLDQLNLKEPSIQYFVDQSGVNELRAETQKLNVSISKNQSQIILSRSLWAKARKSYFKNKSSTITPGDWINPG